MRAIAFYLPQFHPIPENDEWWGQGFTEWTNVARPSPLPGPPPAHLPSELGFYDLRVPETRASKPRSAMVTASTGSATTTTGSPAGAYWRGPFEEVLGTGKPDFPFCLCWANENWTRRWDGSDRDVLMAQNPSRADDERLIRDLLPHFRDPRYIRINGQAAASSSTGSVVLPNVARIGATVGVASRSRKGIGESVPVRGQDVRHRRSDGLRLRRRRRISAAWPAHRHDETNSSTCCDPGIPRDGRRLSAVRRRLRDDARPVVHAAPHGDARLGQHGATHAPGVGVRACEPGGVRAVDALKSSHRRAASRRASG